MTTCIRCHRPLKRPTATGMGPVCAKAAGAQAVPDHERDLFGYDIDKAVTAARYQLQVLIGSMAVEAHQAVKRQFHEARVLLLGWKARP